MLIHFKSTQMTEQTKTNQMNQVNQTTNVEQEKIIKVCPGRLPRTCSELGMLESLHPEIKNVKKTYFCLCNMCETCTPELIDQKDLKHPVVYQSEEEIEKLFP